MTPGPKKGQQRLSAGADGASGCQELGVGADPRPVRGNTLSHRSSSRNHRAGWSASATRD